MTSSLANFINSLFGSKSSESSSKGSRFGLDTVLQRSEDYRDIIREALSGNASLEDLQPKPWSILPSFDFNQDKTPVMSFGASIKPPTTGTLANIANEAGQWKQLYNAANALTPKERALNLARFGASKMIPEEERK